MKAITIKQPWANLIVHDIKGIENRTWKTNYRGKVLVHAGADEKLDKMPLDIVFTESQLNELLKHFTENELCKRTGLYGKIIGSVEIVDCVQNHPSIWAEKNVWNWVLANPIMFPKPIPAKGKLSFWEFPDWDSLKHSGMDTKLTNWE